MGALMRHGTQYAAPVLVASWVCAAALANGASILLVIDGASINSSEAARKTQFESWGHTVTTIRDSATQGSFNTAMAAADVIYIPATVVDSEIAAKARDTAKGVVCEERYIDDDMRFSTGAGWSDNLTQTEILSNSHPVTSGLATGYLTIVSSPQELTMMNPTVASGMTVLSKQDLPAGNMLGVIEAGEALAIGGNAAGRRVRLPWGGDGFNWSALTASGLKIARQALMWAAGDEHVLLHLKLDEASGSTAADSSSYARDGTVVGNGSWTPAVRHRGLSFNGNGKVEIDGLLEGPTSFSIAAWTKINSHDSSGTEIASLGDCAYLRVTPGALIVGFYNGSSYTVLSYSTALAGNGWRHLAATFDDASDSLRLFVDGVQVASSTTTASASYAGLGTKTTIGAHGNGDSSFDMDGMVDDVRVYNRAITAAEVHWLHGFTGHWKLDEVSGTAAADSTGTGNTGAYSGAYVLAKPGIHQTSVGFGAGTNDRLDLPRAALSGATSATTAFWLKTTHTGSQAILSGAKASSDNEYLVFFESATKFAAHFHNVASTWTISSIADGKWHHYALVTQGETNTTTLYRDGVSLGAKSAGPGATPFTIDSGGLIVGQEQDNVGGGFASNQRLIGDLDDLRLYNRALTAAEVVDLYGLMIHWKLDENAGTTIADASGAGRHAAVSNGSPTWVEAVRNSGMHFNGAADDAVSNEDFTPPSEGAVAFWYKSAGPPAGSQRLFGLSDDWEVWQNSDGILRFDLCGDAEDGGFKTASSYAAAGTWYHVAAVFSSDDESYSIYINGELEKSGVSAVNLVAQAAGKLSLATRTGTTERFQGTIDDFRVYNRRLSQAEVYQIYGLAGWYKLDETAGTVAVDSTGLGNDGVFVGNPTLGVASNGNPALGVAVDFSGANHVHIPGLFDRSPSVSVSAWARLDAADSSGADVVSLGDRFTLRLLNGSPGVRGVYYNGSSWPGVSVNQPVAQTGWRHFAVVLSENNSLKVYVDGKEAASTVLSGAISYSGLGSNTRLASHGNGQTVYDLDGRLDEVRIYNRALRPEEVFQLYRGGRVNGIKILTWTETR